MLLDLFLIGLAVTLEPVPITVFILLLSTQRGVIKGLVFVSTWLLSLVVIVAAVELITGGKPLRPHTAPSTATTVVKLVLGVVLVLLAFRRRRRSGKVRKEPTWMAKLDDLSLWTVGGLAIFLQPWTLVAAGAATIADAHLSGVVNILALVLFCLLGSATILAMEVYAIADPDAARRRLALIRIWMDTHRDQVIIAAFVLVGLWLIGKNSYVLAG